MFAGGDIGNAGYSPTNCADRAALFKAVSEGARRFAAIAIVGGPQGGAPLRATAPCGVCRQALYEFGGPDLVVLMAKNEDEYTASTLGALLPCAFGPADLEAAPDAQNAKHPE